MPENTIRGNETAQQEKIGKIDRTEAGGSAETLAGEKEGTDLQKLLYSLIARQEGADRSSKANSAQEDDATLVIDLQALLYRLIEKWVLILLIAILGAVVMASLSFYVITPMYEATSKLYVLSPNDSALNLSDLQIGTYLTSDYQEVFTNWEVHQQVIDNLGLEYSYEELERMLTITNPSDTRILHITVKDADPQEATDMANEYANVARIFIGKTMKTEEPMIMSVALLPVKPVSPRKALNTMLGFFVGGLLAAGIVTVRFIMDDKTKTAEEILKYGEMTTLAIVPAHESDNSTRSAKVYGGNGGDKR